MHPQFYDKQFTFSNQLAELVTVQKLCVCVCVLTRVAQIVTATCRDL